MDDQTDQNDPTDPTPTDPTDRSDLDRLRLGMVVVLCVVASLAALDIVLDRPTNWFTPHILLELTLVTISLGSAVFLFAGWRRTAGTLGETRSQLAATTAEAEAWRRQATTALDGFARAIDTQFTAWRLTPAEREVAVQLLKGLGHKQIAAATGRSERTVRQHAVAVYEKSGLSGRAELAAFFLEGISLPPA